MVVDGRAVVCEVKSSWSVLRLVDIDKLAALAMRLGADSALLAVMSAEDCPARKRDKFDKAVIALQEQGIELKLMTLRTDAIDDNAYLR